MVPRPRNITFHVTDKCPYQCAHCWLRGTRRPGGLPGSYYVQSALRLREYFGDIQVILDGGDPVERPDLLAMVRQMAGGGIRVHLNTTGHAVDADFARRLVDAGLDSVMISLDGSRDVHNRIRNHPEAYDRAIAAAGFLRDASAELPICFIATLQAQNIDDVPGSLEWALDDPRTSLQFQALSNPRGPDADPDFLADARLWPAAAGAARAAIERILDLKRAGARILNPENQLRLFVDYFERPTDFTNVTCRADDVGLLVDSYGNVLFCSIVQPAGSIVTDDIVDILESDLVADLRRRMRACTKTACHLVLNCFYDDACLAPRPGGH